MNISTPTTQALADNIVAQMEAAIVQSVPLLPRAFVRVLAKAISGVFILLYKYAGRSALDLFVQYASDQDTVINGRVINPLKEWGRLIGVGDPEDATQAELAVAVKVLNQTGILPAGSQLLYAPTGVLYLTTSAVFLNAPGVLVVARAASDQSGGDGSGSIGNLQIADGLSFANPLPNIATDALVYSVVKTGADAETSDAYRARIIKRFQQKPQGGALADYRVWGSTVAGILNIYPYAGAPGQVNVYAEATVASSGSADGIPTGPQLAGVASAIELDVDGLASNRPVNAAVNVLAIARHAFDVVVTGLDAADSVAAETSISDALDEYLRSRDPYIGGLSFLPRLDRVTQASVAGIVDDAISAVGGTVITVVLKNGGVPISAYTLAHGEKAKLGTVTFT